MLIAYFDESGDTGMSGGSVTYTLGGLLVKDRDWPETFDQVERFRFQLGARYGLLPRHEVKANSLIRGSGDIAALGLSPRDRRHLWEEHFRLLSRLDVRVFGVVILKAQLQPPRSPFEDAWTFAMQRLQRVSEVEHDTVMVFHDQGDDLKIRNIFRRARRINRPGSAFGGRLGNKPLRQIVDDPVSRDSAHSYFIQVADLVAYAAFRTVIPPSRGPGSVCPASMWDLLGDARWADANRLATTALQRTDQPGVVVWPK